MTGSRAEQAAGAAAAADEADVKQLALSDVGRSQVVEARKTKGPKSRIDATTTTNNAASAGCCKRKEGD